MQKRILICLLLVTMFVMPTVPVANATTVTQFSGGLSSISMVFPSNGGTNSTPVVDIPASSNITDAKLDVEGRGYNSSSGKNKLDFNNPKGSTAWTGSTANIPPAQAPVNFESLNATSDAGLKASDGNTLNNNGGVLAAYQLFEFHVGTLTLANFSLFWEGMGTAQPKQMFSGSSVDLYMWNVTKNGWDNTAHLRLPSLVVAQKQYYFNATSGNYSNYIDARGDISLMASTIYVNTLVASTMATDYVYLQYYGAGMLYPMDVSLDIGADGSMDWNMSGSLKTKVTLSGPSIISGFQQAVDSLSGNPVHVPLKFASAEAGILYISNLSVSFKPKDSPPLYNKTIPDIHMDENTNATDRLDLRQYFSDDGGVTNLVFSIVYQQDQTKVKATLGTDGHHVSFYTMTRFWFGTEKFRVRATDKVGQAVESNNFSVIVNFVDNPPVLQKVSTLYLKEGMAFSHTFNATDPDIPFDPAENMTFVIKSDLNDINVLRNIVAFTPAKVDVGNHTLNVTVNDKHSKSDSMVVKLMINNTNSPPKLAHIPDKTVLERQKLSMKVEATDPDLAIGLDHLTFTTNSTLVSLTPDGILNFTPGEKDVGVHFVTITVKDIGGLTDVTTFKLIVQDVNDPPIAHIANRTVYEGSNIKFNINATDPDAGDEVATYKDDTDLFDISPTGWINFTPEYKDIGVHFINVTVSDKEGLETKAFFKMTVVKVDFIPLNARIVVPNMANSTTFKYKTAIAFVGTATARYGNPLNYTWYLDGVFLGSGKMLPAQVIKPGKHTISLKVSDGSASTDALPVTFTVKSAPPKGTIPGPDAVLVTIALIGAALMLWRRRN